jgi:P27 family predicted phage terminase small subunit
MGKRGPPKTPTKILHLRGSWRSKIRGGEPIPDKFLPDCPAYLRPLAKEAWAILAQQLDNMGVLGATDVNALARYCQTWAKWRECEDFLAQHGPTMPVRDEAGKLVELKAWPQATLSLKLGDTLARLENQFGLTPAARAQLGKTPDQPGTDGKANYFA